jgi:uncharacterized membrane protein
MKHTHFCRSLDEEQVVAAIRAAESRTSGEVRVFVSRRPLRGADVCTRAREEFARLGMSATTGRNAVLFYVVPREQAFAVIGDEAVHACCGGEFWAETARELEAAFARGEFTGGLVAAIGRAGKLLAAHFPRVADDRNELPDTIGRD